jgi:hypothetical protein
MDLTPISSLALLSAGLGGLATLYLIVMFVLVAITLPLLMVYVYSSSRTLAQICYVAALIIVFPGVACIGNSTVPPDYVGGFLELASMPLRAFEPDSGSAGDQMVTFFLGLPVPALIALVVAAPLLRKRRDRRRQRLQAQRASTARKAGHPAKR